MIEQTCWEEWDLFYHNKQVQNVSYVFLKLCRFSIKEVGKYCRIHFFFLILRSFFSEFWEKKGKKSKFWGKNPVLWAQSIRILSLKRKFWSEFWGKISESLDKEFFTYSRHAKFFTSGHNPLLQFPVKTNLCDDFFFFKSSVSFSFTQILETPTFSKIVSLTDMISNSYKHMCA